MRIIVDDHEAAWRAVHALEDAYLHVRYRHGNDVHEVIGRLVEPIGYAWAEGTVLCVERHNPEPSNGNKSIVEINVNDVEEVRYL